MLNENDIKDFWDKGYLIIRNVFTDEEIENYRTESESFFENTKNEDSSRGDILSNPHSTISQFIYDEKVVNIVKNILNDKPVYFGDSVISYGSGHHGWHKDNRISDRFNHEGPDWAERYNIVRVGLYLQDHSKHSGGLAVRSKSHNPSQVLKLFNKFRKKFLSSKKISKPITRILVTLGNTYGKAKLIDSKTGDLVIWNLRLTHSGNAKRFNISPGTKLPMFIESNATSGYIPYEKDRIAFFSSYGAKGQNLDRYIKYLGTRDYVKEVRRTSTARKEKINFNEINPDKITVLDYSNL